MTYTDEQFKELAEFDGSFYTAVKLNYARPLRRGAIERIAQIHREATGSSLRGNPTCSDCIKRVLKVVGVHYLADKEERSALAEAKKAALAREVATKEETPKTEKKVVKTAQKPAKKATAKKTATKTASKKTTKN